MTSGEPTFGVSTVADARTQIGEYRVPILVAVIITAALVAAITAEWVTSSGNGARDEVASTNFTDRLQQLETSNEALKKQLADQAASIRETARGAASDAVNAEQFPAMLSLDKDVYQTIGPFWQVKGLELGSHAQGCVVRGEILGRLFIRRDNMPIKVQLYTDKFESRGAGDGVLSSLTPGRYVDFSVVVPTKELLTDVRYVWISIDQSAGTTAPIY